MTLSLKQKDILKKIWPWAAFVVAAILCVCAPNLYWLGSSGQWGGRQVVCGEASITGGLSENFKNADLQQIVQDPAQWSSGTTLVSGNLIYSQAKETFYLQDGIFILPLDTSNCQGLDVFKKNGIPASVSGSVMTDNGYEFLGVSSIVETAPVLVQGIFNAGQLGSIGIVILVILLIILFFRWLLTLIHVIKPKPAVPAEKKEENSRRSVIFGILAPILWMFSFFTGLIAQILGFLFAWRGLKTPKRKMAIIGMILCCAGFIVMTFLSIGLGNLGVPGLLNFFTMNQSSIVAELGPTGKEPLEVGSYTSSTLGLSIHPPKGWTASSTADTQLQFVGPIDGSVSGVPYQPEFKVGLLPAAALGATSTAGTADDFAASLKQEYKNFALVGEESHTLDGGRLGVEYLNATYTNASGTAVHLLAMFAIDGGNLYLIGSEVPADRWNKYEPMIRDFLETFELQPITYANNKLHLSIAVPLHWSINEPGPNGAIVEFQNSIPDFASGKPFYANINVGTQLAEYNDHRDVDNTVAQLKSALPQLFGSYTIVEDEATTTELGEGIYLLGGTLTVNGIKLHDLVAVAVGRNNVYEVTVTALASTWSDYEPTFMAAIKSFQVEGPTNLGAFVSCLNGKNTFFYGASWSPFTQAQKRLFGSAADQLLYVECSTADRQQNDTCNGKGIAEYPTWEFADGSKLVGEQPLSALAQKVGCHLIAPN